MGLISYCTDITRTAYVQSAVASHLATGHGPRLLEVLGSADADKSRSRFGIHAFTGENGSGKTNVMVRLALRALEMGKPVISTVPLYADKANGVLHPLYIPFTSWHDLLEARNCYLLMDEMTGIANARENAPLPGIIQLILNQLRKRRIVVLWSSPTFEDAQVQIRRITRAVTECQGSWPDRKAYEAAAEAQGTEFDDAWIPNRLFRARTYRKLGTVADFKSAGLVPVVDEWFWGPGSSSFDAYDTNEETTRLGSANDFGQCIICEGTRRRNECSCADYVEKKPPRRSADRSGAHAPNFADAR